MSVSPDHAPVVPPLPTDEPAVPSDAAVGASGCTLLYVLPKRWSLFYCLTKTQWQKLRDRHKNLYPDWERCSCPKGCKADSLDERWNYDKVTHTKVFVGASFICKGCHWLKSLPHRIETWLKQQTGRLPEQSKPPHIIDCLGWSQEQVDVLRQRDLRLHQVESSRLQRVVQQAQQGKATVVPSPVERLSPAEVSSFIRPGQVAVVPWRLDLSALSRYGYSPAEIEAFERRMYDVAAERMASITSW
ncbi:MAG TPA: hypothetical protein VMS17_01470 [Gemmataceae bacterium]|nr:hypothetical protein [Gemmataceae bacterium]